jgi:hypothetical protein
MVMKLLHRHESEYKKEGKKTKFFASSFAATTSTNVCIILDINTIPEAAKIKMVLYMH